MNIKEFKNGAWVTMDDPSFPSGMIKVKLYDPQGNVQDVILCDDKKEAVLYFRAFQKIAKNL